jgi:hypothetical protein
MFVETTTTQDSLNLDPAFQVNLDSDTVPDPELDDQKFYKNSAENCLKSFLQFTYP